MARITKGFSFSLDATFAVVILGLFVAAIYFFSSQSSDDSFTMTLMKEQGDDALQALDASGDLTSINATRLNNSMAELNIPSASWSLQVEYYNYTNGFTLYRNYSLGADATKAKSISSSQRAFTVIVGGTVKYYGVARLKLWRS